MMAVSIGRSLARNSSTHGRVQRIVNFYELGVARLHHQWQARGISGKEFEPESHPYSRDLDLFGTGSIFELLCTARTRIGREVLASWLLKPAECEEIRQRQTAVAELRDLLDVQEDWAATEGRALEEAGRSVRDWVDDPPAISSSYARALAIALPISLVVASFLVVIGAFGHHWLWAIGGPVVLEGVLAIRLLKQTRMTETNLSLPSFELALIVPLLHFLESASFTCSLLKSLQSQLTISSKYPSKRIRVLRLYAWLLNLRKIEPVQLLFAPFLGELI